MSIQIFITGGTIDKKYNEYTGELIFDKTHIVDMLNRSRCMTETLSEVIFLKDSLDIIENERELIYSKCKGSESEKILITHGTDTMIETAKSIQSMNLAKTIVLTGSMIPYSVSNSDALFNLGFAISAVQTLAHGVYVCMNGKIFNASKVHKNREIGIFESIKN